MNPTSTDYPRVLAVGEAAFTVEFGETVDRELNRKVHALDARLASHPVEGLLELVPTYRSLLVRYDPRTIGAEAMQAILEQLARAALALPADAEGRLVEIPVRYGREDGPDLESVADHCNLTADEIVQRHTEPLYRVAMLGFAPGFAYLLGLPAELATPRLPTPRLQVPAGSVGIAGAQTGVYALETPGGWRIIGRTELRLFDPNRDAPFSLKAGDRVRFIDARDG